jgi:hypothetical protein
MWAGIDRFAIAAKNYQPALGNSGDGVKLRVE